MLFWILLAYLVIAFFFPAVGLVAIICMIGPVWMSVYRGRHWCGNICPRGSFYDHVISHISRKRKIPAFIRSVGFRLFMVLFIFAMFGIQMYFAWGDWGAMGRVFWVIILVTTLVGIALGFFYSPRAWCTFCPMGTLSAWVAPRHAKPSFKNIRVDDSCIVCKKCRKTCPMQLTPYKAKGMETGMMDPDCIKCGKCIPKCPKRSITMQDSLR